MATMRKCSNCNFSSPPKRSVRMPEFRVDLAWNRTFLFKPESKMRTALAIAYPEGNFGPECRVSPLEIEVLMHKLVEAEYYDVLQIIKRREMLSTLTHEEDKELYELATYWTLEPIVGSATATKKTLCQHVDEALVPDTQVQAGSEQNDD